MDELFVPNTLIDNRMAASNFWQEKTLAQMSSKEWELLCDGCGLCCLVKIEDEESGEVFNTSVSCAQLNIETCRCRDYENRLNNVVMCLQLTRENLPSLNWLPESCAYKRLLNGKSLPNWHPLITGVNDSAHTTGLSAKWFAQSEEYVHQDQLVEFIIRSDDK